MSDQMISETVSTPVSTIEEVVSMMRRIDELLTNDDGLKWFNFLYLKVTEAVLENPPPNGWSDPQWLARLDVIFGALYFDALRNWINEPSSAPKPWRVLFDARHRSDVMRVQFALCGMNAHINRDLQFALVQTCEEQNIAPEQNSPQHRDYEYVNGILELVEARVIPFLAIGIVGEIEQNLGRLDNILAMWGVRKARDTAWRKSEIFWHIRNKSLLREIHIETLDDFTSFAGKGLIIPVG